MKINFIKQAGGALIPASDIDSDQMTRYKTNEMYEVRCTRLLSSYRVIQLFYARHSLSLISALNTGRLRVNTNT